MADVAGLVATIVTLIDYSIKVGKRLEEYSSAVDNYPRTFSAIKYDLPLLVRILKTIEEEVNSRHVREDAQKDLHDAVRSCLDRVKELESLLERVLPKKSENSANRIFKALSSMGKEQRIKEIKASIQESVQTLTNYRVWGVVGRPNFHTIFAAAFSRIVEFAKDICQIFKTAGPQYLLPILWPIAASCLVGIATFFTVGMSLLVAILRNQALVTGCLCGVLNNPGSWWSSILLGLFRYILRGWEAQYCLAPITKQHSYRFWLNF